MLSDEELQTLCDNATEGPWEAEVREFDNGYGKYQEYGIEDIASVVEYHDFDPWHTALETLTESDAKFIAAARTELPRLLKENKFLREHNLKLQRELEKYYEHY